MAIDDPETARVLNKKSTARIALENFVSIHRIFFNDAAVSAIEMQGGCSSFDFSRNCMVFNLEANTSSRGNPSLAFRITHASFLDTSAVDWPADQKIISDNIEGQSEKVEQLMKRNNETHFAAVLKVCYDTPDLTVWSALPMSKMLDSLNAPKDLLTNHGGWLEGLKFLTQTGRVLRESTTETGRLEYGRYELEKGKWRFKKYTKQELRVMGRAGIKEAYILMDL